MDERPNPDALLKAVQPAARGRGRLKIFFGACAGVGKTYAMLSAAQEKHSDGMNVLVGLAETHGRTETESLLKGLTLLPRLNVNHRGVTIHEFDLDAALAAKPQLILVDELAHTNAPGLRHDKRWMDIEELRDAGIDVYTTLNVQHVESLNDVVAGITGVSVRETVPDAVFDSADDITLVDIPSDDLLERLREGKVYVSEIGRKRAAEHFFKRDNLRALRELALRRVAERLDAQSDDSTPLPASRRPAAERLAVCIGPGSLTPRLLRTAKRMADGLRAPWVVLYVENARHYGLGHEGRLELARHLRLAEEMGGKVITLQGGHAAHSIITYAQDRGITKLIVGNTPKPRWRAWWHGSMVNALIRLSADIDIYVVTGEDTVKPVREEISERPWPAYALGILFTLVATCISLPLREHFNRENVIMLYLIAIIILASWRGWAAAFSASVASFLAYNYFFIPPYYSLAVDSYNDVVSLLLLLFTGYVAGRQTSILRAQSRYFHQKERTTATLYDMSQALANAREREALLTVICDSIGQAVNARVLIWLPDVHEGIALATPDASSDVKEEMAVRWVKAKSEPAGLGTNTMPSARGYYLPLKGPSGILGVLGAIPQKPTHLFTLEDREMLETFASLAVTTMERAAISEVAETRKGDADRERLRNALLSSVSHDLRTPLASIKGIISSLLMDGPKPEPAKQQELLHSAHGEVTRLERIVSNLLEVTRLESGNLTLRQDYYFLPELLGNAMKQVEGSLGERTVDAHIPPDLPALWVDGLLIEQLLVNLIENFAKYTPAHSRLTLTARASNEKWIEVICEDNGPGLPTGKEEDIFDKFTSFAAGKHAQGTGLGLTICRAIVRIHGGVITASNTSGARFVFTLPIAHAPKLSTDIADDE